MQVTKEQFADAIADMLKRLNNGLHAARQSGVVVLMPERVDVEVQLVYTADSLERTSTQTQGAGEDTDSQVVPETTRTTTSPDVKVTTIAPIGTAPKVETTRVFKEAVDGGGTIE